MAVIEERGVRQPPRPAPPGLVFDAAGEGDQPMLFLHGWCGDRSFFAPQFDHFAQPASGRWPGPAGHGESQAPAAYSIDGLAADVAALGRQLGLGRGCPGRP